MYEHIKLEYQKNITKTQFSDEIFNKKTGTQFLYVLDNHFQE